MVLRRLLTPRWILFTLLVVAVTTTFLFFGWWQLSRWESATGDWQNLGYALEWPFFAVFAVYIWFKLLRDAAAPSADEDRGADGERLPQNPSQDARPVDDLPADFLPPLPQKRLRLEENVASPDEPADDPDLAAYNAYLAAIHRRAVTRRRSQESA